MKHELKCINCEHKFILYEDYLCGDCPNCGGAHYYWDYVLDDKTFEEYFSGYYWDYNVIITRNI